MPLKIVDKNQIDNLPADEQQVSLTKEYFEQLVEDFNTRVKLTEGGRLLEKERHQYFPWFQLQEAANSLEPVDPELGRGIKVHFGLDGDNIRYGLNVFPFTRKIDRDGQITLEYDQGATSLPDYIVEERNLVALNESEKEAWQEGPRNNYFTKVEINHDSVFVPLGPLDTMSVILPYELEILRLYTDNEHNVLGLVDPFIRISSICGMRGDGDGGILGFRHGTAFNMAKFIGPVPYNFLDNNNHISLFHYRGADFGNLCPPRCGKYDVPEVLL